MIESFKRWSRARLRRKLRAKSARYKAVWANKPDEDIIHAHKDAMGWIILERPGKYTSGYKSLGSVTRSCRRRLKKYILPEMKKRGIDEREYTLHDFV